MHAYLADDHQILGWIIAGTNDRQNIRMRKYPQLWKFFVEISRNSCIAVTNFQNLCDNIILLPASTPCFTRWWNCNFCMQFQISNVNTFVTGQCCIAWSCLQAQPTLIFETDFLQFLTTFDSQIVYTLRQYCFGLIQRCVTIFVSNWYKRTMIYQLFRNGLIAPEAGVVKWRVAMVVSRIDFGPVT